MKSGVFLSPVLEEEENVGMKTQRGGKGIYFLKAKENWRKSKIIKSDAAWRKTQP